MDGNAFRLVFWKSAIIHSYTMINYEILTPHQAKPSPQVVKLTSVSCHSDEMPHCESWLWGAEGHDQPQPSDTVEPVLPYLELGIRFSFCQRTLHHMQSQIPNEIVIFLSECWDRGEHSCAAVGYKNSVAWWGFSAMRFHQVQSASSPTRGAVGGVVIFSWNYYYYALHGLGLATAALEDWRERKQSSPLETALLSEAPKLGVLVLEHVELSHSSGIKNLQAVLKDYCCHKGC